MMLTAQEIRKQEFGKSLRGYDPEEVKNYLYTLAQDYENVYSENVQLKESIQRLNYEITRYHKLEETMNNSLILAQQTGEMLKENAKKEAEIILENAKKKIAEIFIVYQEVVKRLNTFNAELRAQLGAELEILETRNKKTEELSSFFYSDDIKEILVNLGKLKLEEQNEHSD